MAKRGEKINFNFNMNRGEKYNLIINIAKYLFLLLLFLLPILLPTKVFASVTLGSSVKATSVEIISGITLDFNGANTLTLTGSGAPLDVNTNGVFTASTGTVAYEGTSATTIASLSADNHYYNLTVGLDSDNNTILFTAGGEIEASGSITIASGGTGTHTFNQGNYNITAEGATAVSVQANAQWRSNGTGDLVLGGSFANAGSVSFSANDVECTGGGGSDDISISSTTTDLRTWSGAGTFNLYNITASYQADLSITCTSCTNSGSTSTWTFEACAGGNPVVSQAHFRWRNDDNSEGLATWKRAEDNLHSGQARSQNVRLRFSIKNTGTTATGYQFGLQVAPNSGSGCSSVASSSYTPVPPAGSCGSDVACMADSTQFTSGDASTAQLTAEGTWVAGEMVDNAASISDAITINANYYTEVEYNFQFTTYATYGANYCFRVTNNGALIDTYTKLAEITIEGTSLINRLKGSLRIKGGTRIK